MSQYNRNIFSSGIIKLTALLILFGATSCIQKQNATISSVSTYIQQLNQTNDAQTRVNIIDAIAKAPEKVNTVAPMLVKMLQDNNAQVRASAAKALGEIYFRGDVKSVPNSTVIQALTVALQDKEAQVRANAAGAIALIALPYKSADASINTTTGALVTASQDKDINVRINASRALGIVGANATSGATPNKYIDTKAVISSLLKLLQDKNPQVRATAAGALVELAGGIKATDGAVPELIKALQDSEPGTRFYAAKALGRIGALACVSIPALTYILQNNQKYELINTAHQSVVPVTVLSLGNIAMSLQSASHNLSKSELTAVITDLSTTIKIIEDPKNKYSPEIIASVRNPLENLKKELKNR
ncbi:hypothetical protein NIES4071_09860 [Calothrix sp. NIES-4071]|nr:hypothetical protein NIES4071_09860 [Calothrix sp. NIES-4071]BAZ55328.1 hypothetical protein NIES4105_09820 [Calothrix sp. NIES-4105]